MVEVIALIVSVIALLVTTYTLWRTYWQRGKLCMVTPRVFVLTSNSSFAILPLVLYNLGATPVFVYNLRLLLSAPAQQTRKLYFSAIRQGFTGDARKDAPVDYRVPAVPFPVLPGHQAQIVYCEFQDHSSVVELQPNVLKAVLEYRADLNSPWILLADFQLHYKFKEGFIHENDPDSLRAWVAAEIIEATLPDGSGSKAYLKTSS